MVWLLYTDNVSNLNQNAWCEQMVVVRLTKEPLYVNNLPVWSETGTSILQNNHMIVKSNVTHYFLLLQAWYNIPHRVLIMNNKRSENFRSSYEIIRSMLMACYTKTTGKNMRIPLIWLPCYFTQCLLQFIIFHLCF